MPAKLQIEVLNWAKFNPRKDVNNPSWFRLEHSFMFDPEWDHLDGQELAVWLFLLAYSSFKKPIFEFDLDMIAKKSRVTKAKAESAIVKLTELSCISITSRPRDVDVTSTCSTRRNETDVTNETRRNETVAPPSAFAPETEIKNIFLQSYKQEFKRDYPGWGAKETSQAKGWLKSVSLENAKRLCLIYPKWNDPWVTRVGHPFGVLIKQYVQVAAWAEGSPQLIAKIAAGKAAENVDLKRAVDFQEMKRGLEHTVRQQEAQSVGSARHLQKQLPLTAEERVLAEYGDSFGADVLDPSSESDSA